MDTLTRKLRLAAREGNWGLVIHRCACCRRVFDEHGAYGSVIAFDASTVATDGMCPACGARALEQIARRRGRLAA
jgi:hypothetical protein